ncbi:hypothetical protein [Paenibacillus mucilaginosus]|uniref:Heparinase II/III family protein n=1 Tax=Paenibacillus mucilaginosus (strain KNP414) TaxID=1036673 RepID=F8FAG4_PAEMK|nr:hypothetical protein [Paenibacillus mucilaginosus]AEI39617.1 conserved hypothetical protein [Paenibacillus mucilaginosus KNP414]MCG7218011.1 hypothetical protein [Paenibacillus mucilaginosus]WDM28561.1 hypothetical protein KCX80_04765 [Paenibacillus mucilaginosus]
MTPVTPVQERRQQVLRHAAEQALTLPLLSSGLWFHSDLRDNFYFATHLFAYTADGAESWAPSLRSSGRDLAADVLRRVLLLQDRDSSSATYGHWPLHLGETPAEAKPHPLPVELMGCLLLLFYERYGSRLPEDLANMMSASLEHLYRSPVYRHRLHALNHHEAKHTAQKLLLGGRFSDESLLQEGKACTLRILEQIERFGFKEYGCLPWHWHWIQAFTCVWELAEDPETRSLAEQLLEKLWLLRAEAYVPGAWAGARSRVWPHDAPRDRNTSHDYIQFGDFPAPATFPRLEGAALFTYEVSGAVRNTAAASVRPHEICRRIGFAGVEGPAEAWAHTYLYRTPDYALGGIWERREEFDNEQIRWALTLPLSGRPSQESVNQLLFFHPGAGYREGDDRHASPYGEVLFHRGTVVQLWSLPVGCPGDTADFLVGCLPQGAWHFTESGGSARLDSGVFLSFRLLHGYTVTEKPDRFSLSSPLRGGAGGVILEVLSTPEAALLGVRTGEEWAAYTEDASRIPQWRTAGPGSLSVCYNAHDDSRLFLELEEGRLKSRTIEGSPPELAAYLISGTASE